MSLKHSMRLKARAIVAASFMTVGVLAVILRVGYLSLYKGDELRYKAERRQLSDSVITAGRGTIYDANMKVLAQSASTWLVYCVPSKIDDSRSRRLQIVPIIQSFAQLERNYGKEGADIIIDNTQIMLFGGFAPNSSSAEILSKSLGSRTVMSGSVSKSKDQPSQSLQMMERPLMTPDELKSLPKGTFIVMKTGFYPMKVRLKLFFEWGIKFEEPYAVSENGNRPVRYANKKEIIDSILENYPIEIESELPPPQTEERKSSLKTAPKNDGSFEETAEKGLKCSPKNPERR